MYFLPEGNNTMYIYMYVVVPCFITKQMGLFLQGYIYVVKTLKNICENGKE